MTSVRHGVRVLTLPAEGPVIAGESGAVDVIGDAFGHEARVVVVPVVRLAPEFFRLSSGVAGAVVQKFVNYHLRLVIVGELPGASRKAGPWPTGCARRTPGATSGSSPTRPSSTVGSQRWRDRSGA